MSYIALYRKWRPLVFEDVIEQEHVVKTLRNSINTGRIAHAYLFCGSRGTGKTSMAQIFSRAINCLRQNNGDPCNTCEICRGILAGSIMDVIEMDAASNNSVDNVREIRDEVMYTPSQAKYKVYIIDEVHMLSTGAFNALLKTLEEPPGHVVFILATTEPHKLPSTILSRCQRFDFRRISVNGISSRLEDIAKSCGVTLQKEAAGLIASISGGAVRDAISLLDQCISLGDAEITYENVRSIVGIVNDDFTAGLVDVLCRRDIGSALEMVDRLVMDGKDIVQFVSDLVLYYRNLMICKVSAGNGDITGVSRELLEKMKIQCTGLYLEDIICIIKELSALEPGLKWASHPRVLLEVSLVRICTYNFKTNEGDIPGRLALLERKIGSAALRPAGAEKDSRNIGEGSSTKAPSLRSSDVMPVAESGVHAPLSGGSVPLSSGMQEEQASYGVKKEADGKPPAADTHAGSMELDEWGGVLAELKRSGKMTLYTCLSNTRAFLIDSRVVGIVFGSSGSFRNLFESKTENMEIIEAILQARLGRTVKIRCLDEDETVKSGSADTGCKEDEFVEKARVIADRMKTALNIIDE